MREVTVSHNVYEGYLYFYVSSVLIDEAGPGRKHYVFELFVCLCVREKELTCVGILRPACHFLEL